MHAIWEIGRRRARRSRSPSCRRARWSRSRPSHSQAEPPVELDSTRRDDPNLRVHNGRMLKRVEDYVAGLGLDAYLVGGAVRDELLGLDSKDADFLVPGVDIPALRERLAPHGRTEELVVAGRPVGVRFYPREREIRRLAPAGIELAPPRREVSTGPGRHDFAIVVDPDAGVEDDLARRDFTVNAMARRLEDGALIDPFDGRADLA